VRLESGFAGFQSHARQRVRLYQVRRINLHRTGKELGDAASFLVATIDGGENRVECSRPNLAAEKEFRQVHVRTDRRPSTTAQKCAIVDAGRFAVRPLAPEAIVNTIVSGRTPRPSRTAERSSLNRIARPLLLIVLLIGGMTLPSTNPRTSALIRIFPGAVTPIRNNFLLLSADIPARKQVVPSFD